MLAHGFTVELTVELLRAGLETAMTERIVAPRYHGGGAAGACGEREVTGSGKVGYARDVRAGLRCVDVYEGNYDCENRLPMRPGSLSPENCLFHKRHRQIDQMQQLSGH
jgi:hypothetical protein